MVLCASGWIICGRRKVSNMAVVTFNDVPSNETTLKYSVLGRLSLLRQRLYCEQHGYDLIDQVADRPLAARLLGQNARHPKCLGGPRVGAMG